MEKYNKQYANVMGYTMVNDRITQPTKTAKFATENKVRIGDVFTKKDNNLKLQVTGLNEDKTRVSFINESGNKYSLSVQNFKKAIKEDKMIRGGGQQLNEVAPIAGMVTKQSLKNFVKHVDKDSSETAAVSAGDKLGMKDDNKKETKNENKIKRLKFNKTTFLTESHAQTLIPEQYKVPGNKFAMIDKEGTEYLMECDKFKHIIIHECKNMTKAKKDMERMKQLWEYDTKQAVGMSTINELNVQRELQYKVKKLNELAEKKN
jgi:hypothetical protein